MIPLPCNPNAIVQVNKAGFPVRMATNVSPDFTLVVVEDDEEFDERSKGLPFVKVKPIWKHKPASEPLPK
jgi:hypothetical protein